MDSSYSLTAIYAQILILRYLRPWEVQLQVSSLRSVVLVLLKQLMDLWLRELHVDKWEWLLLKLSMQVVLPQEWLLTLILASILKRKRLLQGLQKTIIYQFLTASAQVTRTR
jgi:hypothetical protein